MFETFLTSKQTYPENSAESVQYFPSLSLTHNSLISYQQGLSNIVGGMFSCVPNATSLSRSLIQEQTGGRTQIASVVSASLILIILLWIAPFFQVLPRVCAIIVPHFNVNINQIQFSILIFLLQCVLSGIIVVALKGMYTQAGELKRFHRESKLESLTWVVTFAAVVLVDVDIGYVYILPQASMQSNATISSSFNSLFFGLCCSLITIYAKGWRSDSALLGVLHGTNIYVSVQAHRNAVELSNIKIFQYIGAINFASANSFKRELYKHLNGYRSNLKEVNAKEDCAILKKIQPHALIIDLSCVSHVDIAACKMFADIQTDLQVSNTVTYLSGPNDRIFETLKHAELLSISKFSIFPTVHDAVLYFQSSVADSV